MGWRRGREVQDRPHHRRVQAEMGGGGGRFFLWSLQNEKKKK